MDLAAFMAATVAAAAEPVTSDSFPTFPTADELCGSKQATDIEHISHNSRISHSPSTDQLSTPSTNAQARAGAYAGVRAREFPGEDVGNVGTVGNTRRDRDLSFPHQSIKVGNVGKEGGALPVNPPLPVADGLALWHAGLARLVTIDPERPPCPGYRAGEWPRVYARALAFLDQFGPQAEALGWTAPRLFGVHPLAGVVRVDHCGALVLPVGGPVRAITATEIAFGHLTHRRKPGQPAGVPWWEFGR